MNPSSNGLVSPEKRLLVCCARTKADAPVAQEIRELCAAPLDWEFVVNEAAVNSILPLVARQISAVAPNIAPPAPIERLTKAARANALRSLTLTAELIKIMDLLRAAGIQAMPYKGPVLAVQAYGDVALREFEDLDIILRQRDMAKVNEIAKSLGYRPQHAWVFDSGKRSSVVPGEYDYRDQARGIVVEFHTELTLRHFPVRPDLDEMSQRLVPVLLSGHEIQTFAPEDMLPLLCIHGSKDLWERISWIADISEFVRSHPQLDWSAVFHSADTLRADRMLRVGLALATKLLSAAILDEVSAHVRSDSVAEAVASEIVRRHLARETRERGAGERFKFRRRMVAGAIAGWRYSLRLATLPADEDSAAMRLPRPLAPLYALMRPFRLLRQYRPPQGGSERRD
jgi:hypothetical protein